MATYRIEVVVPARSRVFTTWAVIEEHVEADAVDGVIGEWRRMWFPTERLRAVVEAA